MSDHLTKNFHRNCKDLSKNFSSVTLKRCILLTRHNPSDSRSTTDPLPTPTVVIGHHSSLILPCKISHQIKKVEEILLFFHRNHNGKLFIFFKTTLVLYLTPSVWLYYPLRDLLTWTLEIHPCQLRSLTDLGKVTGLWTTNVVLKPNTSPLTTPVSGDKLSYL